MSEIDWSKAPEGATHHMAESITDYECWLKKQGAKWLYMRMNGQAWMKAVIDDDSLRTITERPSPAWSGEGLPPAGVECLARFSMAAAGIDRISAEMKISPVWYGKKHVVYLHDGEEYTAFLDGAQFRPIRTPEQIAKDERAAAFHAAICDVEEKVSKWNTTIDCSAAIKATVDIMIAMGYRK